MPSRKTLHEQIATISGIVVLVSGIVAGLLTTLNNLKLPEKGNSTNTVALWIVVVAIGAFLLRYGLKTRSKLLLPEKLRLSQDDAKHLVGRDRARDLICRKLVSCSQLH